MTAARYLGMMLLPLAVAGCGGGLPPPADAKVARAALTAALDAWQEGQPPEKLRERTPPVDFKDVGWDQGAKLKKYEVTKEEVSGLSARFTVKLTLAEKSGAARTRVTVYSADAGPTVVIRPDSLGLE